MLEDVEFGGDPPLNSRVFGLPQNCPCGLPKPCSHALKGRNPQIPLALLDKSVLCAMHFNVIRKSLLRPVLGLSTLTDHLSNTLL